MQLYQLIFYVPASHLALVKEALFAAGGGRLGRYEHCCWQVLGQGQFRPLAGSRPAIGQQDCLGYIDEWRGEMICRATALSAVLQALRQAHPYEEPAYAWWPINQSPSLAPEPGT